MKDPSATRFEHISYDDVIGKNLKVMDTAAFALARDSAMPIIVYSLDDEAGLAGVLEGKGKSTRVGAPL
jgi:uridylate kinase